MNERGQYFEGYDLLIAIIFAFAVLGIILGVITELDKLRQSVCERRFVEGLQSAVNSPDGSVIKVASCTFPELTITPRSLAVQSTVSEQCFEIQGLNSSAQIIQNNSIQIKQSFEQSAYFKCSPSTMAECDISCIVSFGLELK